MKQYTTPDQTAKLMELGFEKPKGWYADGVTNNIKLYVNIDKNPMMFNYSIGELIEMLPPKVNGWEFDIHHDYHYERWICNFDPSKHYGVATNLIDALYNLIFKLKKEGVI